MEFLSCLGTSDLWDEPDHNRKKKQQRRNPYACTCDECPTCEGGKISLGVRKRHLKRAVERGDADAVAALLHCSNCWPESLLKCYLKHIQTEPVARAFAHGAAEIFFDKGYGAGALLVAAREGREGAVRALLAAGVAADASAPGTEAKALPMACVHGHPLCVEALLEHGADPNQRLKEGITPLHLAAYGGEEQCVAALLRRGVEAGVTSDNSTTPLHCAARNAFTAAVKLLLEAGADPNARDKYGQSPLHFAARTYFRLNVPRDYHCVEEYRPTNFHDSLKELVKCGADVNIVDDDGSCPLFSAAAADDVEVIKVLIKNGVNIFYKSGKETVLHRVASGNGGSCLEVLRDRGLDVNAVDDRGDTPLQVAVRRNHLAVKGLIQMGADILMCDREGFTALHRAAAFGIEQSVQELLSAGADPMMTVGEGITALHLAAKSGRPSCIVELLESGVDVNVRTANGKTPLHFSTESWYPECLQELLNRGADKEARDNAGRNIMHTAASVGSLEIVGFLSKHGFSMNDRTSDGQTPLHLAASEMDGWSMAQMINRYHPPVNARDHAGQTPLHVAALFSNMDCVRELLLAGADRTARNHEGESPADVAGINELRRIILWWATGG